MSKAVKININTLQNLTQKIVVFFTLLFANSCATPRKPEPTVQLAVKPQPPNTPNWTSEDCVEKDGVYFFVGYGEGSNKATAIGNALIASRQNALSCLFGGTISSTISISQTSNSVSYNSKIDIGLDYSHVNWSGYTNVPGHTFLVSSENTKIYAQYRWSAKDIEKERKRLDLLSKQMEETAALKKEVSTKQELIDEQKSQLAELKRQEIELANIKSASDKAVAKLASIKRTQNEKSQDIKKVIDNLYCGITIREFIDLFREPDKVQLVSEGSTELIDYISFTWSHFQIRIGYQYLKSRMGSWPKMGDDVYRPRKVAENAPIEFIYIEYGLTNKGHRICKKSYY